MLQKFKNAQGSYRQLCRQVAGLRKELDDIKLLAAQPLIREFDRSLPNTMRQAEFKVFSQFGDDGIIQYLIRAAGLRKEEQTFIEFGVEEYTESNTRFLLINDNWRGLVIDGDASNVQRIQSDTISWRYDLTAVCSFITRENIDAVITKAGISGRIGLLSIDIDGNDYFVWEAIQSVDPVLVVVEYNSVFGAERPVSVPYDAAFVRSASHHSGLYWGCSVSALVYLAQQRGYVFVGCNSAGNNAWFVRNNRLGDINAVGVAEGYVESRFRESRDSEGRLTFVSGLARRQLIADLALVDVTTGAKLSVRELI